MRVHTATSQPRSNLGSNPFRSSPRARPPGRGGPAGDAGARGERVRRDADQRVRLLVELRRRGEGALPAGRPLLPLMPAQRATGKGFVRLDSGNF